MKKIDVLIKYLKSKSPATNILLLDLDELAELREALNLSPEEPLESYKHYEIVVIDDNAFEEFDDETSY